MKPQDRVKRGNIPKKKDQEKNRKYKDPLQNKKRESLPYPNFNKATLILSISLIDCYLNEIWLYLSKRAHKKKQK